MNPVNSPALLSDFSINFLGAIQARGANDVEVIAPQAIKDLAGKVVTDSRDRDLHIDMLVNIAAGEGESAELAQTELRQIYACPQDKAGGGQLSVYEKALIRSALAKAASSMCRLALDPTQALERNVPLSLTVANLGLHHQGPPVENVLRKFTLDFIESSVSCPGGTPARGVLPLHVELALNPNRDNNGSNKLANVSEGLARLVAEQRAAPTPEHEDDLQALRVSQSGELLTCLALAGAPHAGFADDPAAGNANLAYGGVQGLRDRIERGDGRIRGEAIRLLVALSNSPGEAGQTMEAGLLSALQAPGTGSPESDNDVRRFIHRAAYEHCCWALESMPRRPLCPTVINAAGHCDKAYVDSFGKEYRSRLDLLLAQRAQPESFDALKSLPVSEPRVPADRIDPRATASLADEVLPRPITPLVVF
jgi:hypothetical protein